jgi:hypothetical protein
MLMTMRLHRTRNDRIQSVHISREAVIETVRRWENRLTCIALTSSTGGLYNMTQVWRAEFAKGSWGKGESSEVLEDAKVSATLILTETFSPGGYRLP